MRSTPSNIGRLLMALGVAAILYCAWGLLDARLFQHHGRNLLERASTSRAVGARREAEASGLLGRIEIPRLSISAVVVEGENARALARGVGHVPRTAFPGESGNVGLAGHRDTYFRKLRAIVPGDSVRIVSLDGAFIYTVDSVLIVPPKRVDLLDPTRRPTLTLVTCYPFHWIGPAPKRFVVRAHQVSASTLSASAEP
jgi:sortase A